MNTFLSAQPIYNTIPSQELIEIGKKVNNAQVDNKKSYEGELKQNFLTVPSFPKKRRVKSCDFRVEIPQKGFVESPYSVENQIVPGLYLGGRASGDQVSLNNPLGIDFVVNLDHTKVYPNEGENGLEAVNISVYDNEDSSEELLEMCSGPAYVRSDVKTWFQGVFSQIDKYLGSNKRVLVHCFAGSSRSATVVIAYLMSRNSLDFNTAYRFVKEKRYETEPNLGFCMLLANYEKMLQFEK